jgi:23S rRNA pseudouridine1911/1915/1917 synthase
VRRVFTVGGGGFGSPHRVGVVITEHLWPTCTGLSMPVDERLRVNLEAPHRLGRYIGRRMDILDRIVPAQQDAAALFGRGARRLGQQAVECRSCDTNIHSQIPSMGDGEIIEGVLSGGERLDKALAQASGLSRERVKALIAEGHVSLDGKPAVHASAKGAEGAHFRIEVPEVAPAAAAAQDIELVVVFEDEHLIVIDKPAGMVVHPAAGNPDGTLVNALLHHCRGQLSGIGGVARPGIVHRIDKDTSGLLVVAKSDGVHEGLARQFAAHDLERAYLAVCNGHLKPASGTISGRMGRSDANRKKMAVLPKESSRGKHAVTHYKVVRELDGCSVVECRLETGRTHQVRVHLSSIGHALLGDPLYGRPNARVREVLRRLDFRRQALHAAVLGFIHPVTGDRLRFSSDLPPDMKELIDETGHSNR